MNILFLHGWRSVPGGVKPTYLARHGQNVVNPALPDDDFAEAVRIAQAEFDKQKPNVVVGSSRGGAVAMNINSGKTPLVLLCPAWKKFGAAKTVKPNTTILHSRADDVVPFADSAKLVKNSDLPSSTLIEVGGDHRLADPKSLETMLRACERKSQRSRKRENLARLEDIPNVGPAIAADLRQLGIAQPAELIGRDPYAMYDDLCRLTGQRHDPCVLDTFIAAVRFMQGEPKKPWWKYTAERKRKLAAKEATSK